MHIKHAIIVLIFQKFSSLFTTIKPIGAANSKKMSGLSLSQVNAGVYIQFYIVFNIEPKPGIYRMHWPVFLPNDTIYLCKSYPFLAEPDLWGKAVLISRSPARRKSFP